MAHSHRSSTWRHHAVVGAVILSCLVAGAAEAGSDGGRQHASGTGWTAAPLDTSTLGTLPPETYDPLRTKAELLAGARLDALRPDGKINGVTVIDETRRQRVSEVSAETELDVPQAALAAYKRAAIVLAETQPGCHLDWSLLAAIGQVESDQGRYAGAHVLTDGSTSPPIVGIPLNGDGVARIPDTDNGRFDGDKVWDRAVGPMQFIPSTWKVVGVDGDGDGVRDPHDFDDAALGAGVLLCGGGRDLGTTAGLENAVFGYNHSDAYVALVLRLARGYAQGNVDVTPNDTTPGTPTPGGTDTTPSGGNGGGHGHGHQGGNGGQGGGHQSGNGHQGGNGGQGGGHHGGQGGDGGQGGQGGGHHGGQGGDGGQGGQGGGHHGGQGGNGGQGGGEPKPTIVTGTLVACPDPAQTEVPRYCVDDTVLDFGDSADLRVAQQDYDGDGEAEPVAIELQGLVDSEVKVRIAVGGVVDRVNGLAYVVVETTDDPPTEPTPTEPTPTEPTPTAPTPTAPTPTAPTPSTATSSKR